MDLEVLFARSFSVCTSLAQKAGILISNLALCFRALGCQFFILVLDNTPCAVQKDLAKGDNRHCLTPKQRPNSRKCRCINRCLAGASKEDLKLSTF